MAYFKKEIANKTVKLTGVSDPYALSHELLHKFRKHGNIIEHENKITTTGPRTYSKVSFAIEKPIDTLSTLHFELSFIGDMILKQLEIKIGANFVMAYQTSTGVMSEVLETYMVQHVWKEQADNMQATANTILGGILQQINEMQTPAGQKMT
jgi:hypothetical protein